MRLEAVGAIALLLAALAGCQPSTNPFAGPTHTVAAPSGPMIETMSAQVQIPALDPASPMPPSGPKPYREGQFVAIGARATDPAGGAFTYTWSASDGRLAETNGAATLWYPPTHTGNFEVTVTATTERGCKISDKLQISQTDEDLLVVPFVTHSTVACP